MTRFLAILAALTCVASAQTYRTVTADTNNVIRTNFSLVRSQVSDLSGASFAISNITGLQTALDGKLATDGSAAGLSNFPAMSLTNVSGVLGLASGGTGQTNAALAIQALLPAYTNNENKILALNSNATSLIWTTNAGGGTNTNVGGIVNLADTTNGVTNTLGVFNGGTGGTNRVTALGSLGVFNSVGGVRLDTNSATISNNARHIVIGNDVYAPATNSDARGVAIGDSAYIEYGGVAVGKSASTDDGVSVGDVAYTTGKGIAIGSGASVYGGSRDPATNVYGGVAIGWGAISYTNEGGAIGRSAATYGGGAIGEQTFTRQGAAIGLDAFSSNGIAGGLNAWTRNGVSLGVDARTTNGVQLLTGTNTENDTIQLLSAGSVDTNEWSALANSTTIGREIMQAATNGSAAQVLALNSNATDVEWIAVSNTVTDASTLTNFPASILQTNSADGSFPAFLLRTNGSAAGLTSFPPSLLTTNGSGAGLTNLTAANITGTIALASNVSGTIAISNGGTGATTASNARVNLLPSYTGNADRILALNSNATDVIWTTNTGGGSSTIDLSTTNATGILPLAKGGTGGSTQKAALIGLGIYVTNGSSTSIGIGENVTVLAGAWGTAVGQSATTAITSQARSSAFGYSASASTFATALGAEAAANGQYSVAVGFRSKAQSNNTVQLGEGSNGVASTIQFRDAGTVNETEWGYLANASTKGGSRMTNTNGVTVTNTIIGYDGTNYSTNTITVIDGIITSWTQ